MTFLFCSGSIRALFGDLIASQWCFFFFLPDHMTLVLSSVTCTFILNLFQIPFLPPCDLSMLMNFYEAPLLFKLLCV